MSKAFSTFCCDAAAIVFAETASKARYATYRAAREAGYEVRLTEITCRRAASYDGAWRRGGTKPKDLVAYVPEYLVRHVTLR